MDGSSTATTPGSAFAVMPTSSRGSFASGSGCRGFVDESAATSAPGACPPRRSRPRSSRLLELTLLRVGNEEYVRLNQSFGLSTLRSRHARIRGQTVRFRCRGKAGRVREVGVTDRRLAAIVRRCQDLPGQRLFEYVDPAGATHEVDSEAVNAYLRRAAGDDAFSAKDFRTWTATVLAFRALQAAERPTSAPDAQRTVVSAVRETAERLGNTPAVARLSYVHPAVLEAYLAAGGVPAIFASPRRVVPPLSTPTPSEEAALLELLRAKGAATDAARPLRRRLVETAV